MADARPVLPLWPAMEGGADLVGSADIGARVDLIPAGRGMKVGKERGLIAGQVIDIAGAAERPSGRERRDAGVRARETRGAASLAGYGLTSGRPWPVTAAEDLIVPDPTANPSERLHVAAWSLASRTAFRARDGPSAAAGAGGRDRVAGRAWKLPGDRARPRDRARLLPDGPLQPASRRGNRRRREARGGIGRGAGLERDHRNLRVRPPRPAHAPGSPGRTDPWW